MFIKYDYLLVHIISLHTIFFLYIYEKINLNLFDHFNIFLLFALGIGGDISVLYPWDLDVYGGCGRHVAVHFRIFRRFPGEDLSSRIGAGH